MSLPPPPEHLSLLRCTEQSCFLNVLSRDYFMKNLLLGISFIDFSSAGNQYPLLQAWKWIQQNISKQFTWSSVFKLIMLAIFTKLYFQKKTTDVQLLNLCSCLLLTSKVDNVSTLAWKSKGGVSYFVSRITSSFILTYMVFLLLTGTPIKFTCKEKCSKCWKY